MKKVISLVILCSSVGICFSQLKPKTYIYNKPLGFFTNSFEVGFDKKVGPNTLFGAMIGYGATEGSYFNDSDVEEFKLELNFKTFIRNYNEKHTYYFQPFLQFKQRTEDGYEIYYPGPGEIINHKASVIHVGFMFAKRFNWNRLFLDLQVGGGIISPLSGSKEDRTHISNPASPYTKGVNPRIGLNFGFNI